MTESQSMLNEFTEYGRARAVDNFVARDEDDGRAIEELWNSIMAGEMPCVVEIYEGYDHTSLVSEMQDFAEIVALSMQRALLIQRQHFPMIVWCADDIQSIRPDWSDDKCAEAMGMIAKVLKERSTEEGWQIMKDAISNLEFDGRL